MDFIVGCNNVIVEMMKTYSTKLRPISTPTAEQYTMVDFDINYSLPYDVIVMEVRAYTMKFVAEKKREEQKTKKDKEDKINKVQNSNDKDDMEEFE